MFDVGIYEVGTAILLVVVMFLGTMSGSEEVKIKKLGENLLLGLMITPIIVLVVQFPKEALYIGVALMVAISIGVWLMKMFEKIVKKMELKVGEGRN